MIYQYSILCLSICLLYYLLFKYNHGKEWKSLALVGTLAGMIASIGSILEGYFPSSKSLIKSIFAVPVIIALLIFFYLIIPLAWRMRKDPARRTMINIGFGLLILTIVLILAIFVLAKLGFFG